MPFQIIETIERGKRLIETVPSTWTRDGYLFWPKKNFLSLKKIEGSIPQHDWKPYPCIILRDNILDYKVAEQEVALMSDATDTDDGHNKENEHPEKTKVALDLNNLVMECIQLNKAAKEVSPMVTAEEAFPRGPSEEASPMVAAEEAPPMVAAEEAPPMVSAEEAPRMVAAEDAPSVMVVESNTLMPMDVNNVTVKDPSQETVNNAPKIAVIQNSILNPDENLLLVDSSQRLDFQIVDPQTTVTESIKVSSEQVGYLIELVTTVQENQKVLFENQQNILKAVVLTNTKLEEYITSSQLPVQHERHEVASNFKTINNIEELKTFEEQLKYPIMETKYLQELPIICSDKKTGHNNAYALVDAMFDRQLMTRCSWGGGTKGEPKHCFKAFTRTINLFLKVVHQYDKTFTKPICEDFFKNVMRHSTKRNIAKRVRDSTTKKKMKKSEATKDRQDQNTAGAGPSNDNNSTQ